MRCPHRCCTRFCTARRGWPTGSARALEARYERLIDGSGHLLLPYDSEAARWHAVERARLGRAGLTPAFVDSQIAAIAATRNLTLVTRNTRDFECFDGVRLDNWFATGNE